MLLGSDATQEIWRKNEKTMFGPLIFICLSLLKLKILCLLYIDLIMEITQIYGGHHFYKKIHYIIELGKHNATFLYFLWIDISIR